MLDLSSREKNEPSADPEYRQMELNPRYADGEAHDPATVSRQMADARAQAAYFEQQREQWESQRRELELVNERKAIFAASLNEVGIRIHNSLRRIEQERASLERESDELRTVADCFKQHLQILSALHPKTWSSEGLVDRLREALPKLDRAENDFREAYFSGRKMQHSSVFRHVPGEEDPDGLGWRRLRDECLRGLFFHLPLFVLLVLAWLCWVYLIPLLG